MRSLWFAVLGVALGGALHAQTPDLPSTLTLEEALRIAEARNPLVVAAQQDVAASAADVTGARKRLNPALSFSSEGLLSHRDTSFLDGQQVQLGIEQEIETAGRRGLRTEQAQRALAVSRSAARDALRRLRLDVCRAYMQAVLARADDQVARDTLAEIDKIVSINRARYEQGELSGVELRRLQVERFRFADEAFASELALRNARSALLALLDIRPLDRAFEVADVTAGAPDAAPATPLADGARAVASALADRPDLQAARHQVERADAGMRLQAALATPNLTVGVGVQRDYGSNGVLLSVGVPLPFFDRNQAGVARGAAERRQAEARQAAAETQVTLDVQQALNALDVSRRRLGYVEGEYLKSAREARDIVLASYRSGAASLIDYLDAQRALREAQRTQNRAHVDYRISVFQYEAAVGAPTPSQGKDRP
jgi:outer membrane protein, heavy metal efflux system